MLILRRQTRQQSGRANWLLPAWLVSPMQSIRGASLTQNRDARAISLKLNELIRAIDATGNQKTDIEKLSDEELDVLQARHEWIRAECMEGDKRIKQD
jgi:low affinity Fe/Cu permease